MRLRPRSRAGAACSTPPTRNTRRAGARCSAPRRCRKTWPPERWLELIATLPAPVLLILGEAEQERWSPSSPTGVLRDRKSHSARDSGLHLALNLPLEDLVAQLSHCRLFLGHDSGVSH